MLCKICGNHSAVAFGGTVLNKYDVSYYRCANCGFLQTDEPYWLEEAYSSAISDLDIGLIWRAEKAARFAEGIIGSFFNQNGHFIDWGGGYGVFTRMMRDRGYDFYWRDPHATNIFAKDFVAQAGRRYELMTCFEVFEHLPDPMAEIHRMMELSSNIFFTTEMVPREITEQKKWWYLGQEAGQHISFYSFATLQVIAANTGSHLTSDKTGYHLLSEKPVSSRRFNSIVADGKMAWLFRKLVRRKLSQNSLLDADFQAALAKVRKRQ